MVFIDDLRYMCEICGMNKGQKGHGKKCSRIRQKMLAGKRNEKIPPRAPIPDLVKRK